MDCLEFERWDVGENPALAPAPPKLTRTRSNSYAPSEAPLKFRHVGLDHDHLRGRIAAGAAARTSTEPLGPRGACGRCLFVGVSI